MKNIDIFVHEKYNKADYEKVAEPIYKTYDDSDSKCTDICSKKRQLQIPVCQSKTIK